MDLLLRILLVFCYPFLLLARAMNALRGTDRMRLREPPNVTSLWLERKPQGGTEGYFSEASATEGSPQKGAGSLISRALRMLARFYAPNAQNEEKDYIAAADRKQGIPDEVYTLW
jgi:hypothetical protein